VKVNEEMEKMKKEKEKEKSTRDSQEPGDFGFEEVGAINPQGYIAMRSLLLLQTILPLLSRLYGERGGKGC